MLTSVLLFVQVVLAFSSPEILTFFHQHGYYFSYFWPLKFDDFVPGTIFHLPLAYVLYSFLGSLLLVPLLGIFFGKRWYCSWGCGCGGLANTAGDPLRQGLALTHVGVLVAIAVVEAERIWPSADLPPSEPPVEVFESFSAACFEPELFKAQFVAGNFPDVAHQRGADAPAAAVGVGLNPGDRAPVRNDPGSVPAQVQPSGEDAAELGEQDLLDIEDLVNQHVLKNEEVRTDLMDIDQALATGTMALFGEKYGDRVRVLSVDDGSFSRELCGGTHVRRTGDIGLFKIVSEGSVAAGTRRIEAITGLGVLEHLRKSDEALGMVGETLRAKPGEVVEAAQKLAETEKKLRKELDAQQMKRAAAQAGDLLEQARDIKGVRVGSARVEGVSRPAMRQMVDQLRTKLGSGVIALGAVADGKAALIIGVTKDLTARLDAGKIVRQAAAVMEGSGGGRKDLAEAGGKNPERLDECVQAVPGIIEKML